MKKLILTLILPLCFQQAFSQARQENFQLILKDDWKMQSAVTDAASADKISKDNYDTQSWYKVSVPTTIVAGLLANKVYDFDPFMGRNLKKLSDPKLDKPWWFRREFTLPAAENGKNVILRLHGINYKANIWLNGVKIADSTQTKGPFRIIQLDVTKHTIIQATMCWPFK
jgi:exo-1,4-beta-D-glucosaminidase